jgi:hypothetical protein
MPHTDRQNLEILERTGFSDWPNPPLNVSSYLGFKKECVDIRWDSPVTNNSCFSVLGVNIYRSFDSEGGPYQKLNSFPISGNFWRDQTDIKLALNENVSNNFVYKGNNHYNQWIFRTNRNPIYIENINGILNCTDLNVFVTVNGVHTPVSFIHAFDGSVEISNRASFNTVNQTKYGPVLPTNDSDVVLATYRYVDNLVKTDLGRKIYYKVTTLAFDSKTQKTLETPLNRASTTNRGEVEKIDYIWKEALRRSKWILQQGGERVKLFIRKTNGQKCGCSLDFHKSPDSSCASCFGSGVHGFG